MHCVMYVQWNVHRKSLFACAYKRGVAGPNEIQDGGQIQIEAIFFKSRQRL